MLFSELKDKEVVNIKDCRKLGHICDLEFDCQKGCILKVIIPGKGRFCNFFSPEPEQTICYCEIKQIGPDIILVDI